MFWIFVRIACDSNKYSKHMFYEEIRIKQGVSYISFCPLKTLYNSKFILMATSMGTNAVVVTRVHCLYVCGLVHPCPVCGFLVCWLQLVIEPLALRFRHSVFDYM